MQSENTSIRALIHAEALPIGNAAHVVGFSTPLNAYSYPDRRAATAHGHAVAYTLQAGGLALSVWRNDIADPGTPRWRETVKAVYVMDDGATCTALYVAGHTTDMLILHPFPVNERPLSGTWRIAPTRAYHLTLDWIPSLAEWHADRYGADDALSARLHRASPDTADAVCTMTHDYTVQRAKDPSGLLYVGADRDVAIATMRAAYAQDNRHVWVSASHPTRGNDWCAIETGRAQADATMTR